MLNLLVVLFSLPRIGSEKANGGPEIGVGGTDAFPISKLMLSARFNGLLGEALGRASGLEEVVLGRTERSESRTPERSGVEKSVAGRGAVSTTGLVSLLEMEEGDEAMPGELVPKGAACGWGQGDSGEGV